MAVIILTAFALRIAYAVRVGPSVDEYITTLAINRSRNRRPPILPSGFVYDHGILFVYIDAAIYLVFWFIMAKPSIPLGVVRHPACRGGIPCGSNNGSLHEPDQSQP